MVGEAQVVVNKGEVATDEVATIDLGRLEDRSSPDPWRSTLMALVDGVFPVEGEGEGKSGG